VVLLGQQAQIYNITSDTVQKTDVITAPPELLQSITSDSSLGTVDSNTISKPLGTFVYPLSGNSISSKAEIKFQVEGATSVEFYVKRVGSSTEIYLGAPSFSSNNTWIYYWNSTSTPNGDYYIIPYISNKYGRYAGSSVYISINNQAVFPTEQITQLKQEITSVQNTIQTQQEQLNNLQTNLNNSVSQKTNEISNVADDILSPEKSSEVKKELNIISEQIKSTAGTGIQDLDKLSQELNTKAGQVSTLLGTSEDKAKVEQIQKDVGILVTDSVGLLNSYLFEKKKLEQTESAFASKDSDNDGLPDNEEIRLGTNPFNPDTDGDGFFDGSEVKLGYDPITASTTDKIAYQNPKEVQAPISTAYEVNKVELVESPQDKNVKVLKIEGKAPANSFVTIYIYSTPTIVVTKTDENGNWEYTLDKPLSDGRHTVYASVTNNTGDIEAVSKAFDFAKAEDKIVKLLSPAEGTTESPSQNLNRIFVIMLLITVFLAVVFVVIVLGIYLKQHNN